MRCEIIKTDNGREVVIKAKTLLISPDNKYQERNSYQYKHTGNRNPVCESRAAERIMDRLKTYDYSDMHMNIQSEFIVLTL